MDESTTGGATTGADLRPGDELVGESGTVYVLTRAPALAPQRDRHHVATARLAGEPRTVILLIAPDLSGLVRIEHLAAPATHAERIAEVRRAGKTIHQG